MIMDLMMVISPSRTLCMLLCDLGLFKLDIEWIRIEVGISMSRCAGCISIYVCLIDVYGALINEAQI